METIRRTKIVDLLKRRDFGVMVNVKGWVRTRRGSKQVSFIALNDGSTINNVQVVVDLANFDEEMLKVIKSVKDFQATPIQEIWHNDGDQVLAYERKDLIFVFNFNPKQSFTDYGFLVAPGA